MLTSKTELIDRINDLITAVYRTRSVDPWIGGSERAANFESVFRERLPEWPLRNQSDLKFGGATVLAFLLHPGQHLGVSTRDGLETRINRLGGQCFMALLEISHLGPFARIRFTKESYDRAADRLDYEEQDRPFRDEDYRFLDLLSHVLEQEGIENLPREILELPVPDVQLDVTDIGCATVYHCLFDEE
jgi:hypothetical protein